MAIDNEHDDYPAGRHAVINFQGLIVRQESHAFIEALPPSLASSKRLSCAQATHSTLKPPCRIRKHTSARWFSNGG